MKKPKRRKEWRQNSPRDQLVTVFGALEGHASNLEDGVITQTQFHEKTLTLFRWAQELLRMLPDAPWPELKTKPAPAADEGTGPWDPNEFDKRSDEQYRRELIGTDPNEK